MASISGDPKKNINNYMLYAFNNKNGNMLSDIVNFFGNAKLQRSKTYQIVYSYHIDIDGVSVELYDKEGKDIKNPRAMAKALGMTYQHLKEYVDNNRDQIYPTPHLNIDFEVIDNNNNRDFENRDWATFIEYVPERIIVGYYIGDILNGASTHSSIMIRSEFRGQRLCLPFVTYTYKYIIENFDISRIDILIMSETIERAGMCYYRSAKANQLIPTDVYGKILTDNTIEAYLKSSIEPDMYFHRDEQSLEEFIGMN